VLANTLEKILEDVNVARIARHALNTFISNPTVVKQTGNFLAQIAASIRMLQCIP